MSVKPARPALEFGDFQTPRALADLVCQTLIKRGIYPQSIVEPTCGIGAFVLSALSAFPGARQIVGLDIRLEHIETLRHRLRGVERANHVWLYESDFFTLEWRKLVTTKEGDAEPGPNVIPDRYGKPETTPLKVTVNEGQTDLPPFQITTK